MTTPRPQLSLWDATSIIVGIVIGSGIYESTPTIAASVPSAGWLLAAWVIGGAVALVGALSYAELTTTYPEEGGDYVYLSRAFGGRMGFLFAWAQLWVVRPGSIGAVAYVFARYAQQLAPLGSLDGKWAMITYAAGSIVVLTAMNLLGAREGKWTQNLLTAAKVLGLLGIFAVALVSPGAPATPPVAGQANFYLAAILVMFTFGGWNDMSLVAAEVRDPQKNLARALLLGTGAISVIYALVNGAFLQVLGLEGIRSSQAVAADALQVRFGPQAGRIVSGLICISCLGAINGMIFTGARIYVALGSEFSLFAWLGAWNDRLGTPVRAMVIQSAITLAVVVGFGVYEDGFQRMVIFTAPAFWFFIVAVSIALFQLRDIDPARPRQFRVPLYPLTPLIFFATSLFMVYATLQYAIANHSLEAAWAIGVLAVGGVASLWLPDA